MCGDALGAIVDVEEESGVHSDVEFDVEGMVVEGQFNGGGEHGNHAFHGFEELRCHAFRFEIGNCRGLELFVPGNRGLGGVELHIGEELTEDGAVEIQSKRSLGSWSSV